VKATSGRILQSLVAVVMVIAGIGSAVFLFVQIQPGVPASEMRANCATTSPTPTEVVLGSSGQATFSCNSVDPVSNPAFTTTDSVIAVPTFIGVVLPYNASRMYIYEADGTQNTGFCSDRTLTQKIEDGEPETIPANGWNYCAEYVDVPPGGLPEFSISWST
jgi:hypothetical protein